MSVDTTLDFQYQGLFHLWLVYYNGQAGDIARTPRTTTWRLQYLVQVWVRLSGPLQGCQGPRHTARHWPTTMSADNVGRQFDVILSVDIVCRLCQLHSAEGTSQSLEQQFGTIFRPICDSTRSHCCHLDKN